jgi:hypothetical protein
MIDRTAFSKQAIDALVAGDVGRDRGRTEFAGDRIQPIEVARGDDDFSPLAAGEFGGRKTDTGRPSDNHDLLARKHDAVLSIQNLLLTRRP